MINLMTEFLADFSKTLEDFIILDSNVTVCFDCKNKEIISEVVALGALSDEEDEVDTEEQRELKITNKKAQ